MRTDAMHPLARPRQDGSGWRKEGANTIHKIPWHLVSFEVKANPWADALSIIHRHVIMKGVTFMVCAAASAIASSVVVFLRRIAAFAGASSAWRAAPVGSNLARVVARIAAFLEFVLPILGLDVERDDVDESTDSASVTEVDEDDSFHGSELGFEMSIESIEVEGAVLQQYLSLTGKMENGAVCSCCFPLLGENHWISRGCSRDQAEILVKFQKRLIHHIVTLKMDMSVSLDIGIWELDAFITADDAVQCPSWHILCRTLRGADAKGKVSELTFLSFDITTDILEGLGPALADVQELNFEDSRFGIRTLSTLAKYLESNTSLTNMRLMAESDGEELEDLEGVSHLFNVLEQHPNLRDFCMARKLRNHPDVLPIIMNSVINIEKVSFCWMHCPGQGHHIANAIARNGAMGELLVGCETCNGKDAADIACALATNTNLRVLDMSIQDRMFDPDRRRHFQSQDKIYSEKKGAAALRNACFDLSSGLNNVLELNHTCALNTFGAGGEMGSLQKKCNELIVANAPKESIVKHKLLHALGVYSEDGVDLAQVKDLPVELLPEVLHLLQVADDNCVSTSNTLVVIRDIVVQRLSYLHHTPRKGSLVESISSTASFSASLIRKISFAQCGGSGLDTI